MPERGPRPSLGDHLQVAWVILLTILNVVPAVITSTITWWLRRRARRALATEPPSLAPIPVVDASAWEGRTVFVVAGEASGDRMAANVIGALRGMAPGVRVRGYGGPACQAAGMTIDRDLVQHAVWGFWGVVGTLGFWWRVSAETVALFRTDPPDLVLTVDFPGLNVRIARWARARGIPTVHLVAPQVWAHSAWRIFRWRRAVDRVLATFPFESVLLTRAGIETWFVGHPLFEAPLPAPRTPTEWPGAQGGTFEIWPGSRRREIASLTPVLLAGAARILEVRPQARFVVRLAEERDRERFAEAAGSHGLALEVVVGPHEAPADLIGALACSGTATAELASQLVPLAGAYRTAAVSRLVAGLLVTAPFMLLPNLIAGGLVVPEALVVRPEEGRALADKLMACMDDAASWAKTRADLTRIRTRLEAPDVLQRTAAAILSVR